MSPHIAPRFLPETNRNNIDRRMKDLFENNYKSILNKLLDTNSSENNIAYLFIKTDKQDNSMEWKQEDHNKIIQHRIRILNYKDEQTLFINTRFQLDSDNKLKVYDIGISGSYHIRPNNKDSLDIQMLNEEDREEIFQILEEKLIELNKIASGEMVDKYKIQTNSKPFPPSLVDRKLYYALPNLLQKAKEETIGYDDPRLDQNP
jgi:hypothetical protein